MIDIGTEWSGAERRAREALATHDDTATLADARFERIVGSLSNYAWHAALPERQVFVRLARDGSEALGANLAAEAEILHRVGAAGLAPQVVRCDPARRLLVTRWIEPHSPVTVDFDASTLALVATALANLHRMRVPTGLRHVRFDAQARMLARAVPASIPRPGFTAVAADVFGQLEDTAEAPVLCHNDIHAQNVIVDSRRRLWLVDWEYAGLGDPVFDLASCISQGDLSTAASAHLCAVYEAAGGRIARERLEWAHWAFDYVQWLWYQGLLAQPDDGPGHAEAVRRSARLERRLLERASAVLRCNNR